MNSNNVKKMVMIDLHGTGHQQNILLIQDQLVYIQGNNVVYAQSPGMAESLTAYAVPVLYALNPSDLVTKPATETVPVVKTNLKSSFLVYKNQKYTTVPTEQIAFFYIQNDLVCIMCFDRREFVLNQTLDSVVQSVSEEQFYRLNRKYLINFKAIKEVEHFFMRKLFVKLVIDPPDQLLINKEKTQAFLSWMGDR